MHSSRLNVCLTLIMFKKIYIFLLHATVLATVMIAIFSYIVK